MKISKRLESIALLVNSDDIINDVGCDHALLDIYLINEKIVSKIYVSDVNENALNNGIKNINKYGKSKEIITSLSNGIEKISKDVNTLIISGMGANTIINILDNPRLNQINKLIIESNNDYELLRKWITSHDFYIDREAAIYDSGKYYINMVFLRGYKKYSKKDLKFGPLLKNKDYFNYLIQKDKNILKRIPKLKIKTRLKYFFEIKSLKKRNS